MTKQKNILNVLGIMSGTSMDGVDFVLCKIQRSPFKMTFLDQGHSKFPDTLKKKLIQAAQHELKVDQLALLHYDLGEFYAHQARKHQKNKKWKIDLVGLHGQTVFHSSRTATLQIGEGSYLSELLRCPVVCDFRSLDIASGGEGAPIATLFHQRILAQKQIGAIAIQNLGGIANVTYMNKNKIMSFDTGPANMLMDLWIKLKKGKNFDPNGYFAEHGIPDVKILNKMMSHPFLYKKPPKSCGREEFGINFLNKYKKELSRISFNDQMATLLEFTARSIALNYIKFFKEMPKTIYLCGGGAKNKILAKRIQFYLSHSKVETTDVLGWPVDIIEGASFALLAAYRFWGMNSSIPSTTGARRSVSLGKLIEP